MALHVMAVLFSTALTALIFVLNLKVIRLSMAFFSILSSSKQNLYGAIDSSASILH